MKTSWKGLLALLALTACAPAGAVGRLMDLSIYDRTSQQTLPVYSYGGRYYVAGQPGHRYQIQLRNREGRRVLSVLSVDGVNALSGDTADWSQDGYVLSGFGDTEIRGWRKSLSEVADFVFADAAGSYAARTGRPDNVGVIGVAVFLPKPPPRRPLPMPMPEASIADRDLPASPPPPAPPSKVAQYAPNSAAAMPAPPAPAMPLAQSADTASGGLAEARRADTGPLGTGHGERETSIASYTSFQRMSSSPNEVITLYYDTRERLIAQGVIPQDDEVSPTRPDPFPGHFVPDPR